MSELTTSEYYAWVQLRRRCTSDTHKQYERYRGRGITFCDRWETYENFLEDMGRKPTSKHSIDRIDNNGNYEPGNCRWATKKEQGRNRSTNRFLEFNGESKSIAEWAEIYGLSYETLRSRINLGWTVEDAIETASMRKKLTINGKTKNWAAWAKENGISPSCIKDRIKRGVSGDKLLAKPEADKIISVDGKDKRVADLSKEYGINPGVIYDRVKKGLPFEDVIRKTPRKTIKLNGEEKTITEWAKFSGMGVTTLRGRLEKGWSIEDAIETPVGEMKVYSGKRVNIAAIKESR